jgi:putative membrane protein
MHTTHLSRLTAAALCVALSSLAASVAAAQVTTSSSGDVSMLSQKNIVDHMIVGDSIEIAMAQLAESRTQNAAVRDFAKQLVTDHQAHLDNLHKLAGKKDIGREANPADMSGAHFAGELARLQAMPADSGFDRAFIQAQIQHHQADINALKTMRAAAKDDDVQQDIDKTLPILESHLSRANEVAAQLGRPGMAPDSMKRMGKPPV